MSVDVRDCVIKYNTMPPKGSRKRPAPKSGTADDAEIDSKLAAVDLLGA
jgi:hypothetical protein